MDMLSPSIYPFPLLKTLGYIIKGFSIMVEYTFRGWSMAAKLVVFDTDGTLLADRLIFVLADNFGFRKKLETIIEGSSPEH